MTQAEQKKRAVAAYFYDNPGHSIQAALDHLYNKFGGGLHKQTMGRIRRSVLERRGVEVPGVGPRRTLTSPRVGLTARINRGNREYLHKLSSLQGRSIGYILDDIIDQHRAKGS